MKKIRYLRAQIPSSLRRLADRMRELDFTTDSSDGFRLTRVRENFIEAHYFEKFIFEENVIDPFGQTSVYQRVRFSDIEFILSNCYPELEIVNPPRNLSPFFSRLSEITDSRIAIEVPQVDLLAWVRAVEKAKFQRLEVSLLEVSDVIISPKISGKIVLASKEDVRSALKEMIPNGTYSVSKARLSIKSADGSFNLMLGSDATLRFGTSIPVSILEIIKTALPKYR